MKDEHPLMRVRLAVGERLCLKFIAFALAICATTLLVTCGASAQSPAILQNIPVPSEEEFTPADDVIGFPSPGNTIDMGTVRLYNKDGSLWYEFSLDTHHSLYYKRHPNPDFKPFAPLEIFEVAIRLQATSRNWYEVIVDHQSQQTKYIWAGDPLIRRETFARYVLLSSFIKFDKEKNPLRATPNGQPQAQPILDSDRFGPVRIEGDWLLVEIYRKDTIVLNAGWIRWKKDRDFLIEFMLTNRDCI